MLHIIKVMKNLFIIFIFVNLFNGLYAQNKDIYFGGDIGLNFGIQDINESYKSLLIKNYGYNFEIERSRSFAFSLYAGCYGFTRDIAIQIGVDFSINEEINQASKVWNIDSTLSYSYVNVPLLLRISRKIFTPSSVGIVLGPYISFPLGEIEEKSFIGNQKYNQEVTWGIEFGQFITYSLKTGNLIFGIKYTRDFMEKFLLSDSGIDFGVFTQQDIKITIGYEYHFNDIISRY
jgi:hypothetical protein